MDLYDAEILYWDYLVEQLYEVLGDDPSILWVVTSDHGESLGDRGGAGHGISVYEEQLRVPLIFYGRNWISEARVVREPASSLDILPTLLVLCGIDASGLELEGRNALASPGAAFRNYAVSNEAIRSLTAVYEGDWKYIHDHQKGRHQLFDLDRDPEERRDAFAERRDVAARLARQLAVYTAANRGRFYSKAPKAPEVDVVTREKLKALGYVR